MIQTDFSLLRLEQGTLTVTLTPPTSVAGWDVFFQVKKYFMGESGLVNAYAASGYNNASGINVTNTGQGVFNITIPSAATSGWNPGNFPFSFERTNSGFQTVLTQGLLCLGPSING